MRTEIARPSDAVAIAAVLREAAQWLVDQKIPLWLVSDFTDDSVQRDVDGGLYVVAKASEAVVGVVRFQREDPVFWPDAEPGTSAFLHKLAVRRAWAGQGVIYGTAGIWVPARTQPGPALSAAGLRGRPATAAKAV